MKRLATTAPELLPALPRHCPQVVLEFDFVWSGEQHVSFVVKPVPKVGVLLTSGQRPPKQHS